MPTETSPVSPEVIESTWTTESLTADHINGLVKGLIPPEEMRQGRQFGVHVIDGKDPASDIGRYIEAKVFDQYFGNDLGTMKKEYGEYDEASTFLMVIDYKKEQPVGVIRLIRSSPKGFKTINDITSSDSPWYRPGDTPESRLKEIGGEPDHTIDIATMAVMPDYKSGHSTEGVSAALYSTCVRWSFANGYNTWVTVVDKKIYSMMQSWGEPFITFEGASWASYLDSEASLPVHTELYEAKKKIEQFDKEMTEKLGQPVNITGLYTKGDGLHDWFVLPDFPDNVQ